MIDQTISAVPKNTFNQNNLPDKTRSMKIIINACKFIISVIETTAIKSVVQINSDLSPTILRRSLVLNKNKKEIEKQMQPKIVIKMK